MSGNNGAPLTRRFCRFALQLCIYVFVCLSPLWADAADIYLFNRTALESSVGMIQPGAGLPVFTEPIRTACSGLREEPGGIFAYNRESGVCSLYDDGHGRNQPSLDSLVVNEVGLQTSLTAGTILAQGKVVWVDSGTATLWCVPPKVGQVCVTVQDTTPPVIEVPGSVAVYTESLDGAVSNFSVIGIDTIDPNPVVTCTPPPGSLFPLGDTLVSCTATDRAGNSSSGSFYVRVNLIDLTRPKADLAAPKSVPINQPFTLDGSLSSDRAPGAVALYIWTNRNIPGITGFLYDKPVETKTPYFVVPVSAGNTLEIGVNTFSLTVVDAFGNQSDPVQVAVEILPIPINPGDCDADGAVSIAEVQAAINMYLGLMPATACVDTDGVAGVSIAEVQKVINGYLGL